MGQVDRTFKPWCKLYWTGGGGFQKITYKIGSEGEIVGVVVQSSYYAAGYFTSRGDYYVFYYARIKYLNNQ